MEDAVGHRHDLRLNRGYAVGQRRLLRLELAAPPVLPVVDDLTREPELLPRGSIQPAQIAPHQLGLVEHRRLELGIGPGARHARPQLRERPPLERIAPNGLRPHQQGGEDHEGESEEELAVERHGSKIPPDGER